MRLHRLQLSAFGPFADEIDIDLDALGADGLFLLHGDTGAGKTTLLDAIAFALFGRVPGARNEAKRLRCDRSDSATRTFVRIEATVGGHRIEIQRSPAYLRPKARGAGLTEEKPKVLLRWLDAPPGGARADGLTRAEEVGQVVADLLGMSADQFFQVVLLPQGEFARFLRSDTAEREVLLERLFDTGRFGTVEEWFSCARRESGARLRERNVQVGQLLARVAQAAGVATAPDDTALVWLADVRDRLADRAALAAELAESTRAVKDAADRDVVATRQLAERIDRLRDLRIRQSALEKAAGERASWRRALNAQVESRPLMDATTHAARLARLAREQQARTDGMRVAAESLVAHDEDVPKTAPELRAMAAVTRERAGGLAGLIVQARDQDRDQTALAAAQASVRQTVRRMTAVEGTIGELPGRIGLVTERARVARASADRVAGLVERVEAARTVYLATTDVVRLTSDQEDAIALCTAATDQHQRAVDHRQELVELRIAGMSAELAHSLVDGESCPVCGSGDHPRPARSDGLPVTAAQVAAAERSERIAAAARQQAVSVRESVSLALAQAQGVAAGRDSAQATAEWEAASSLLDAATTTAADLIPAESDLSTATEELRAATDELQILRSRHAAAVTQAELLDSVVRERAVRLTQASAGYPDVASRRRHLQELADALDLLAASSEQLDAAEVAQAEASTTVVELLGSSSFSDLAEVKAAHAVDHDGLTRRLRAAEDELTVITARLSDPDLAGLDITLDLDVDAAERDASTAASLAATALRESAAASDRRDQVAAAAARFFAARRELDPVLAADAELSALTDVILGKGQNSRAMSLRSYVLAAKLAQVASSAGQRLSAMSAGRYTFVRSEEKESRGRSGGLGLDIFDAFSGLVRPAKTLSGGESFLASLALALGLADVVAAEAGGRQLDTMFIDEGFGSLDADTLDMVMGTLDELRAGGRIVGLVSHVDELRQRIPSRLKINRTATGSELEMSVG